MTAKEMYLIGNWKENPETLSKALTLAKEYIKLKKKNSKLRLGIAAPMPFLPELIKKFGKSLTIFSQSVSGEISGSHTGEVSANQLISIGVKQTIIGHSERRSRGETNEDIKKQVENALAKKMRVVLCVGERERHEDTGHMRFVNDQLESALLFVKKTDLKNVIIAYEPVWAIGEKAVRSANENEIYEMTVAIRKKLVEMFAKNIGGAVPIIYGGSASSKNAEEILKVHNIQGFLLGRASLDAKEVSKIIEIMK